MCKFAQITTIILAWVHVAECAKLVFPAGGKFLGSGPEVDRKMGVESSPCETLDLDFLRRILGAAFNPRYMSLFTPHDNQDVREGLSDIKRNTASFRPFSVDDSFVKEIEQDVPAWEVNHFDSDYFSNGRNKRSVVTEDLDTKQNDESDEERQKRAASTTTPWECKSIIKWIDLGTDYFPRYLRNVECVKHNCWYGRFQCKPKSFTVKLLRRKNGKCANNTRKQGVQGLPQELRELWVWEERAVNFCCECAAA